MRVRVEPWFEDVRPVRLADEAAKVLGVKTRTEAVHVALREVVAVKRFKRLMRQNAGRLSFAGYGE